jgi:hypothetical protein
MQVARRQISTPKGLSTDKLSIAGFSGIESITSSHSIHGIQNFKVMSDQRENAGDTPTATADCNRM